MIYHLCTAQSWDLALSRGFYTAESLKTEGFIHCSTEAQLLESAEKHWKNHEQVVVLHIVEKRVKEILKYEPSRNNQLFPHLYGKLPVEAVETTTLLAKSDKSYFEWIR